MDMIQHYRPQENVLRRPTMSWWPGIFLNWPSRNYDPIIIWLVLAKTWKKAR